MCDVEGELLINGIDRSYNIDMVGLVFIYGRD
jgi:hypothetical protein